MSAFICHDKHINAIVRWACKHNVTTYYGNPSHKWSIVGNEQATVDLLYAENVRSVNHRYPDQQSDEPGAIYDAFAPELRAPRLGSQPGLPTADANPAHSHRQAPQLRRRQMAD